MNIRSKLTFVFSDVLRLAHGNIRCDNQVINVFGVIGIDGDTNICSDIRALSA